MIDELIHNYTLKGIHLDYIRFPNPNYSYDSYSRKVFENEFGFDPLDNPNSPLWRQWRENQTTNFVNDAKILIKNCNLTLSLSCAVFPIGNDYFLQKWEYWVNQKLIDFLAFMSYTTSTSDFEDCCKTAKNKIGPLIPYYMGIGIYRLGNDTKTFKDEVKITWKYEVYGWILFRDEFITPFTDTIKNLNDFDPAI